MNLEDYEKTVRFLTIFSHLACAHCTFHFGYLHLLQPLPSYILLNMVGLGRETINAVGQDQDQGQEIETIHIYPYCLVTMYKHLLVSYLHIYLLTQLKPSIHAYQQPILPHLTLYVHIHICTYHCLYHHYQSK